MKKNSVLKYLSLVLIGIVSIAIISLCYQCFICFNGVSKLQMHSILLLIVILLLPVIFEVFGILLDSFKLYIATITLSIFIITLTFLPNNTLNTVKGILDVTLDKYQEVEVVLVEYNEVESEFHSLDDLKNSKVRVATIAEEKEGVLSATIDKLDELNADYGIIEYKTVDECINVLKRHYCDIVALPSNYKDLLEDTDDLDQMSIDINEFAVFKKSVNVNNYIKKEEIDLTPFNVLLMGYSRTDIGSSVGLTDAIIVATVNPKTFTISLLSIPRDSFVSIPCYNNEKMKINAGREESIECFIDTVEALIGMDIDYYLESDYEGVVNVVNTIGGILIDNPVTFSLDGFTVPEGTYKTDGWHVLEFCRERHSMPNGVFDREKHQRETVYQICKELISYDDSSLTLTSLYKASKYINTNIPYSKIVDMYNLVKNAKNYTKLDTYQMIDFHDLTATGYASWHYSNKYKIDLWIYRLYEGSVKECVEHINYVLGKNITTSDQEYSFVFDANSPYEREEFYHTSFDEKQNHNKYD